MDDTQNTVTTAAQLPVAKELVYVAGASGIALNGYDPVAFPARGFRTAHPGWLHRRDSMDVLDVRRVEANLCEVDRDERSPGW